jgi:hypothetical protein
MKISLMSRMLLYALYAGFAAAILITASLPFLLDFYSRLLYDAYALAPGYRAFILPFLLFFGAAGIWVILELIWMLRSIPRGPFIMRNVLALKRVGFIFLALGAEFFVKCFFYATFLTMLGCVIFLLGGMFAFTLANLFRQAVAYREENDLTI